MRSDRLFSLIQILRDGKLHRAADLAARLEVSTRTIWRDMTALRQASGLPVEGERGVGYMLTAPITLPPVALTQAGDGRRCGWGSRWWPAAADPGPGLCRAYALSQKFTAIAPGASPAAPALDAHSFSPVPKRSPRRTLAARYSAQAIVAGRKA